MPGLPAGLGATGCSCSLVLMTSAEPWTQQCQPLLKPVVGPN